MHAQALTILITLALWTGLGAIILRSRRIARQVKVACVGDPTGRSRKQLGRASLL